MSSYTLRKHVNLNQTLYREFKQLCEKQGYVAFTTCINNAIELWKKKALEGQIKVNRDLERMSVYQKVFYTINVDAYDDFIEVCKKVGYKTANGCLRHAILVYLAFADS